VLIQLTSRYYRDTLANDRVGFGSELLSGVVDPEALCVGYDNGLTVRLLQGFE
jgi:hypothetical protein